MQSGSTLHAVELGDQGNVFKGAYDSPPIPQSIGRHLLWALVVTLTLGLGLFWVLADKQRVKARQTTINGRALEFTGTAFAMFTFWARATLFSILTLGLYGIFFPSAYQKFLWSHRVFADEAKKKT